MALDRATLVQINRSGPHVSDALLDSILAAANSTVELYAPAAPDDVKTQASGRLASWLLEARGDAVQYGQQGGFRRSGCQSLLAPWHKRRAARIEASDA